MWPPLTPEILAILMTLLGCGLLLNLSGIYCCIMEKTKLKKQKIILLNLSAVEIIVITHTILHLGISRVTMSKETTHHMNVVLCTFYNAATSLFYNSMLLISLDRLVCVLSPINYR